MIKLPGKKEDKSFTKAKGMKIHKKTSYKELLKINKKHVDQINKMVNQNRTNINIISMLALSLYQKDPEDTVFKSKILSDDFMDHIKKEVERRNAKKPEDAEFKDVKDSDEENVDPQGG